jgi:hypothetical protein
MMLRAAPAHAASGCSLCVASDTGFARKGLPSAEASTLLPARRRQHGLLSLPGCCHDRGGRSEGAARQLWTFPVLSSSSMASHASRVLLLLFQHLPLLSWLRMRRMHRSVQLQPGDNLCNALWPGTNAQLQGADVAWNDISFTAFCPSQNCAQHWERSGQERELSNCSHELHPALSLFRTHNKSLIRIMEADYENGAFKGVSSSDVGRFVSLTACPSDQAAFFLEANNGDFDRALEMFYGAPARAITPRPLRGLAFHSHVKHLKVPTNRLGSQQRHTEFECTQSAMQGTMG